MHLISVLLLENERISFLNGWEYSTTTPESKFGGVHGWRKVLTVPKEGYPLIRLQNDRRVLWKLVNEYQPFMMQGYTISVSNCTKAQSKITVPQQQVLRTLDTHLRALWLQWFYRRRIETTIPVYRTLKPLPIVLNVPYIIPLRWHPGGGLLKPSTKSKSFRVSDTSLVNTVFSSLRRTYYASRE